MIKYFSFHSCFLIVSIFTAFFIMPSPSYAYKYYVDEPQSYENGDCGSTKGDNRPDRTYPIRNGLNALGWTGLYYTGPFAWPQDFIDKSVPGYSDGLDDLYADKAELAVFSGHGDSGYLHFSHSHNNRCGAGGYDHDNGVIIGDGFGDRAANMIVISCCYLNPHNIGWVDGGGTTQIMGYGGFSSTDAGMVEDFFNATQNSTNVSAWLDNMEDRPDWFTGDNSPAVLTKGWTWEDVDWNISHCRLKGGVCWGPWAYNTNDLWQLNYKDHGCDGCTGC